MYPPCRAAGKRRLSSVYHYIKGYREKQFLSFPSAEGKRFRRYSGLPLEATLRPRRAWTVAAFGGREMPPPGGGGKRGQGHRMVPLPPLDSPKPSFGRDSLRSRGETGETGARFRASMRLWTAVMPWIYFARFAAHDRARPDSAGRQRFAAKSSASIKGCALGHQTSLWAPRI